MDSITVLTVNVFPLTTGVSLTTDSGFVVSVHSDRQFYSNHRQLFLPPQTIITDDFTICTYFKHMVFNLVERYNYRLLYNKQLFILTTDNFYFTTHQTHRHKLQNVLS